MNGPKNIPILPPIEYGGFVNVWAYLARLGDLFVEVIHRLMQRNVDNVTGVYILSQEHIRHYM
jgi:hypothetical protein